MAWIDLVRPQAAEGLLARIYADAVARAGRVWNILAIQSQNPAQLRASMGLYTATMKTDSALSPRLRETLAVVVSRVNDCHY